ncbi:hypothetical protein HN020_02825 [Brevibacillus borstelensis]|uniref:DUF6075 family protein n=1 Tax=Brevibacillus borstelensis TaxID=45462 RepID=UPI001490012F|nr:DUF6075 family protein [Brevibacillus borstelensis]NOU53737.1 hypothetical protein [Brevibacillus borstelensis]
MYHFLSNEHKARFQDLCGRDGTHYNDSERRALFFVIAGNDSLFKNVDLIYDFDDHVIKLEVFEEPFLTGGTLSLIDLGFSLYGYGVCDVKQLFSQLDYKNSILAIEAIKSRFQILEHPDCKASAS